ncbi:MAG: thioredoxin [Alphaproteobacteria bacterium]|nr:thioredoxin [Alphaproteobacteria bacterium]
MIKLMKMSLVVLVVIIGFPFLAQAGDTSPTLGDDGIYHYNWYHQSFFEMADDIDEALAAGKVLMVKFDQKGCIYCEKVATEILSDPAVNKYVRENFLVVQMDIFGSRDVTDLDGTVLPENEMAARWGIVFTPSIFFVTEKKDVGKLPEAAAAMMPGAFMRGTFLGMLQWVKTGSYKTEPRFQKYYNDNFQRLREEIKAAKSAS